MCDSCLRGVVIRGDATHPPADCGCEPCAYCGDYMAREDMVRRDARRFCSERCLEAWICDQGEAE